MTTDDGAHAGSLFGEVAASTSRSMRSNWRRDTCPEVQLRQALHRAGFRYFVDRRIVTADGPVRRDIVFPKAHLAIYVDGCIWHGCPIHGRCPSRIGVVGSRKSLDATRDVEHTARLSEDGWHVLRFWKHERAADLVTRIASLMRTD